MKNVIQKVISFIKRVFFFLKLHVHVEAGIRGYNNKSNNTQAESDDPDVKE